MDIYLDFDHTLYNPITLTDEMLSAIRAKIVNCTEEKIDECGLMNELKGMFNREHIYNIFELARYFAKKYSVEEELLVDSVNKVLSNCSKNVFEDVVPFLKSLKEKGYRIFMLTYYEYGLEYQMAKVTGSKLCDLFDVIITTGDKKFNLTIDYEKSIFVDDNPKDLAGLATRNPYRLIRIRRKEGRYSEKPADIPNLEEVELLTDIKI